MPSISNRLITLVALAGLSTAAGYLIGRGRPVSSPPPVDSAAAAANANSSPSIERAVSAETASPVLTPAPSLYEQIDAIRTNERPDAQPYLLQKLFETMTAEEAPALLERLLDEQTGPGRPVLLQWLFERWGELAGEEALLAAKELSLRERAPAVAAALGGMAVNDPDQAWQIMVQAAKGWPAITVHVGNVIDKLARHDLVDALGRRNDIASARGKRAVQHAIIRSADEAGKTGEMLAGIATFESVEDRKSWFSEVFTLWAATDSEASLAALETIADPVLARSAVGGFLTGWSRNDPVGAASYVLDHRSDPTIATHMTNVLNHAFASGGTGQTTVLVERLIEVGAFDDLGSRTIMSLAYRHPELGLQAASSLSDEKERARSIANTIGNWASRDVDAAVARYDQLTDPGVKQTARRPLAFALMRREDGGSHLIRLVDELPVGRPRAGFVENLLSLAVSPNFQSSSGPVQALQGIIQDLPELSDTGRKNAETLFGADALPAAYPATP